MDFEEAVTLSEAEDLAFGPRDNFAKVKTSMFLLYFTGKKSELNLLTANLPTGGHIYWRSNRIESELVHRVILKDETAAIFARMFGGENPVKRLTVGELAEARNLLDIPWLPANKGFLSDRIHDAHIRDVRYAISFSQCNLPDQSIGGVRRTLDGLSQKLGAMLKRPRPYEP